MILETSKLFTVRNRPVLFTQTSSYLSEAVTAIERGAFPISPTGYHSLAGCFYHHPDEPEKRFDDAAIARLLETLARDHAQQLRSAIVRAKRAVNSHRQGSVIHYIRLDMAANNAASLGFFATDEERRELWQTAYKLYHLICDSGLFIPHKMADPQWNIADCALLLTQARKRFDLLKQLMSGNFDVSKVEPIVLLKLAGSISYFELPPKPEGEPVIPQPATALSFSFANEAASASSEGTDDEQAAPDESLASATEPEAMQQQLALL